MTDLSETAVNTEYGQITVPRALLDLWNRHGWPSDDTLQAIAEEQGVYPPKPPADNAATSDDEADNPLRVRYSAAIDEGFRTFDADQTDGYLIDHITDAVLACRNADLAALRVWLSTEAARCRRNADAATVDEAAQALGGMAAGCELAARVIDGMTAGRGLPVSGGAKAEAGAFPVAPHSICQSHAPAGFHTRPGLAPAISVPCCLCGKWHRSGVTAAGDEAWACGGGGDAHREGWEG